MQNLIKDNPERLAWVVLLSSFAICLLLTISLPLAARWWIDTAHLSLKATSSVQQGTVQLTCEQGATVPNDITERIEDVCQGVDNMAVLTLSTDQGLLTIYTPDATPQPLAQVQVDYNTQLRLVQARAPRFPISSQPYTLIMRVESGQVRVHPLSRSGRSLLVQINTPHALIQTNDGHVSVKTDSDQTYVEAYQGMALVVWKSKGEGLTLERFQSALLPPQDGKLQALPSAQNLISNGDFSAPLESGWRIYSKDIEFEGEPPGGIAISTENGQSVAGFTRLGRGHAETGITQRIQRDVQDFESLKLRLNLRVMEQNVPVCGTRGTECPVMVKMEYEDAEGNLRTWWQGFYVSLDPNRINPPFCTVCSPRADHLRIEQDTWYVYDSPNLVTLLGQAGPPPARILSISLYASGHTYRSEVSRVELLAR